MKLHKLLYSILLLPLTVSAAGYELMYKEEEPGIEPYISRIVIDDRYLRIDDLSDDSGYILYDDEIGKIYSVSHYDKSILVISSAATAEPEMSDKLVTSDKLLDQAPKVAGKPVHDYRVELKDESFQEMCTNIQYAAGLMQEAGEMMHAYQTAMVANQVSSLQQTPVEFQTPCMISDQIYFDGSIYSKGLPLMEWRSNGKKRLLQSFKRKAPEEGVFTFPEGYRQFSIN